MPADSFHVLEDVPKGEAGCSIAWPVTLETPMAQALQRQKLTLQAS